MSFADEAKHEYAQMPIKHNCCRRALAEGLLVNAVFDPQIKGVFVRYTNEATATLATELLSKLYAKQPEVRKHGKCGHTYWDLILHSPACVRLVRSLDDATLSAEIPHEGCDSCRGMFLRGLFLACGTLNCPDKPTHFEWKVATDRAPWVSSVLTDTGYPPRTIARNGQTGLYYKNGETVADLISLIGAGQVLFRILDKRMERELRNNENRATNCVTRNIQKTISAATRQMDAINRLVEAGKLDSLPEALQETARKRYDNPDVSLDELASLHSPVISRSGLNHRLKKLLEAAHELSDEH